MSDNWKDGLTDRLCEAFLVLRTRQEVYDFLEDIATINQLKALSQRLEVARLLKEARNYPQIARQTGASTATISRVKKCLSYGTGGYGTALERLSRDGVRVERELDVDWTKGSDDGRKEDV